MTEQYRSDVELLALEGAAHDPGIYIPAAGETAWDVAMAKALSRIADALTALCALEIFKDGDLTFGVRPGKYLNGATAVAYAGASAQALTDDATNYVYLTADGTLTVSTAGFPAATVPHIPLATIATASGAYSIDDIVDYRTRAMLLPTLGVAQGDLQDLLPAATVSCTAEVSHKRTITVQVKDAAGNNLAAVHQVRVGIAATEYAAPSGTDNTVNNVASGAQWLQVLANAAYEFYTDATGKAVFDLAVAAGAKTRYAMAAVGGRVYSSGAIAYD